VREVVDIRSIPRSRTNPQYNLDRLPEELAAFQVGHRYLAALGGLRKKTPGVAPEVNALWRNQSFHNYADYALTAPFRAGLVELLGLAAERRCAIMCSEAVWWRCHRRIIADYLLARGIPVLHLMGNSRIDPARITPAAEERDGHLVYPAP
jgi:uncharacterized protein (DUF488 family)